MLPIVDRKLVRFLEIKGSLPPDTCLQGIIDLVFYAKLLLTLNYKSKLFNVMGLRNTYPQRDELSPTLKDLGYPCVPP